MNLVHFLNKPVSSCCQIKSIPALNIIYKKPFFYAVMFLIFLFILLQMWPFLTGIKVDDTSYYTTAHGILDNINIYDETEFYALAAKLFGQSIVVWPYTYPPLFAQILLPLCLLQYQTFTAIWMILNIIAGFACIFLTFKLILREKQNNYLLLSLIVLFCLESQPFKLNILYGQAHFIVYILIILSLLFFRKQEFWLSSLFLSLATFIKIFPVIFMLYFLFKKDFKYIMNFILSSLAILFLSIVAFGSKMWIDYVFYFSDIFLKSKRTLFSLHFNTYQNNKSLRAFLFNLIEPGAPGSSKLGLIYLIFIALFLVLSILAILRRKDDIIYAFSILGLVAVVLSPMSWRHHYVMVVLPFFYLLFQYLREKRYIPFLILCFPVALIFYYPNWAGFPFSYMILFALIGLLAMLLFEPRVKNIQA